MKIIKKIKFFNKTGYCVEFNRPFNSKEDVNRFNKEMEDIRK